jgi:hypothetical protein
MNSDICPNGYTYRQGYTKQDIEFSSKCVPRTRTEIDREFFETRAALHRQAREIFKKDMPKKCSKGKILREGYYRNPYTKSSGTQVKGAWVKPVCVPSINANSIEDKQKRQLFRIEPHVLSKYGYHNILNLTERQRHNALMKALKDNIKPVSLLRRVNALAILQKNTNPELSNILREDIDYIRSTKIYQNRFSKK